MSHFTVTVAVAAQDADEASENIGKLLAPFEEELDVAQKFDDGEVYWYNPKAKWDWWTIGGRWSGELRLRADADPADYSLGERSGTNEDEPIGPVRCDLARITALDVEAMRAEAATKAVTDWDEYASVVAGTPQHLPWSVFVDKADAAAKSRGKSKHELEQEGLQRVLADLGLADYDTADALKESDPDRYQHFRERSVKELQVAEEIWQAGGYTIDKARVEYREQPRIAALRNHPPYMNYWFDGPEDAFDHLDRDEYAQLQRAKAVPGFATLTHDGRWLERGRMGWFGMSSENAESTDAYLTEANAYIDGLADLAARMWLGVVDCHI